MRSHAAARLAFAGILAAAATVRFVSLGTQSFWYDEAVTKTLLDRPFGDMLDMVPRSESTPPLYYCLAWLWTRAFGLSEAGIRSLSALAGVATVAVAYAIGRELADRRAGLLAAALVAANPMLVWYSQEARAYALVALLAALSALATVAARAEPSARRLGLWSAAAALLLLTHYFGVFLVVPEAVLLLATVARRRGAVALACVPWGLVGLALVPLAHHQEADGRTSWITGIPLGHRVELLGRELFTANTSVISMSSNAPSGAYWVAAAAALAVALVAIAVRARRIRPRVGGLGLLALAALVVPFLLGYTRFDFFLDRNLIAVWPVLAAALAVAVARAVPPAAAVAVTGAIAGAGLAVCIAVASDASLQRPDWRGAVRRISDEDVPRAVVIQPTQATAAAGAYGLRLVDARVGTGVREVVALGTGTDPARAPTRIAAFRLVERSTEGEIGFLRYRAPTLQRLNAASLAGERGLRYMPSRAARVWFDRFGATVAGWRQLETSGADALRQAQALLPVPPELPDPDALREQLLAAGAAVARHAAGRATRAEALRAIDQVGAG